MFLFQVYFFEGDVIRMKTKAPEELMGRLMRSYQGLYAQIVVTVTN